MGGEDRKQQKAGAVGVTRRWVFPIIRLVLVAVVAVALVKLAFFGDGQPAADPLQPTAELIDPTVAVQTGTIVNDVTVSGSIVADPAAAVRATAGGVVDEVQVAVGATVEAGATLYDIKVETPRDPVETTGPDGLPVMSQPKPAVSYVEVTAPIGGVVSALPVIPGQAVTVGEATGGIAPPTFSATASLPSAQQYRLLNRPTEGLIAIKNGPAPFACTGLTISTPAATAAETPQGAGTPSGGDSGATGSTTTVRCAIPAGVTVFAGLAADLTMSGGRAEGVLTVPTTAIKGTTEKGIVYVPDPKGGDPKEVAVTLGLTDGKTVEVRGGVKEGDTVLEFVPGARMPDENGCITGPDGSMSCASVGS